MKRADPAHRLPRARGGTSWCPGGDASRRLAEVGGLARRASGLTGALEDRRSLRPGSGIL